jgi:hypothetical protein
VTLRAPQRARCLVALKGTRSVLEEFAGARRNGIGARFLIIVHLETISITDNNNECRMRHYFYILSSLAVAVNFQVQALILKEHGKS